MKKPGLVVLGGLLGFALAAAGCGDGGGAVDAGKGGTDGGTGGKGGSGGGTGDSGVDTGGDHPAGGSGGADSGVDRPDTATDAGQFCGGCISMNTTFTASGQTHGIITQFAGADGVDLHGATITAHIKVVSVGNSSDIQLYPQDVNYGGDYNSNVTPMVASGFTDVVYHVPAAPVTDVDSGVITYDTTKIRQILFQVDSSTPVGGSVAETVIWIDSVTITGAPAPTGGATYGPFSFDDSIAPFTDSGVPAGVTGSVTWIP